MTSNEQIAKMKKPPVVTAEEWQKEWEKLLVKEKELTHARDAMAAARRRMPWLAVEKEYFFDGTNGKLSLLDLFEGRRQLVLYRAFYDSNVYGSLKGKVERISADTIVDDHGPKDEGKNETFYRVMVRTGTNHLGTNEHPLPILPGMVATVEVLTGQKTVLDYLIKPARMLKEEALRER